VLTLFSRVIVMAEGNETSGEQPGRGAQPGGFGPDSPARRSEGDLFAERRARRAAETGEDALTRRAEAAEATVQTLERHVASLQQRLQEAEEESARIAELLKAEKTATSEREQEMRLVKQRDYAGLEEVQRQLAEAEQAADAGRAELRRAEHDLQARLGELEARAAQMQRGLDAERAARERTQAQLERMSRGHAQMQQLVVDMKAIVERLTGAVADIQERGEAAAATPVAAPIGRPGSLERAPAATSGEAVAQVRGTEMADALAAAVERLRARAEVSVEEAGLAAARPPVMPTYKHSLSLIGRWRLRRKQRRSR
jgi:chaperonin cofactor prefoldin